MQSNQQFMIVSLLNLYLKYIETKSGKKPVLNGNYRGTHQEYKTKQHKISAKEPYRSNRVIDKNIKTTHVNKKLRIHSTNTSSAATHSKQNFGSIDDIVAAVIDNEKDCNDREIIHTAENIKPITHNNKVTRQQLRERIRSKNPNSKPRVRRWAVRPSNRDWAIKGFHRKVFSNIIKNMDEEQFFAHTRMSKSLFDWLLTFVQSSLKKSGQRIGAEERLVITLNFLAYGTRIKSIAFKHKLGISTVRQIVLDTCEVLWNTLSPLYLCDLGTSQYVDIANDFKSSFDIPNCVGAIDGKLMPIRFPAKKKLCKSACSSMLLMGACDARYRFTAICANIYDNQNDAEIYKLSPYMYSIVTDQLPLPSNKPLYPSSSPFPHYFVSNKSFPLRKNIMRPYESTDLDTTKAYFNYKISRANSVIENSFGILTSRWRILLTTIEFLPEYCKNIVMACIVLHNYIITNDEERLYCPANFIDQEGQDGNIVLGEWRSELENNGDKPLESVSINMVRSTYEANNLRDTLANSFVNDTITYEPDDN